MTMIKYKESIRITIFCKHINQNSVSNYIKGDKINLKIRNL